MNKPRILVVEDNAVVAELIRHLLGRSEYSVAGMVTSGEEALQLAFQYRPDLTLMDVELAGPMDGIEAARMIWSQLQIPVIYLTSSSDDETIHRAASTEAFGYLHKPVKERELISSIKIALAKHDADRCLEEKDGTERVVEENTSPILNDRGEIIGVVLVFGTMTTALDVR